MTVEGKKKQQPMTGLLFRLPRLLIENVLQVTRCENETRVLGKVVLRRVCSAAA